MATEPDATVSPDITERWDENDPSLIPELIKRNLHTLIDKAERKLTGYTGGIMGASWTNETKAVVNASIVKANEIINRPSEDLNEWLSVAEELHTGLNNLVTDIYDI